MGERGTCHAAAALPQWARKAHQTQPRASSTSDRGARHRVSGVRSGMLEMQANSCGAERATNTSSNSTRRERRRPARTKRNWPPAPTPSSKQRHSSTTRTALKQQQQPRRRQRKQRQAGRAIPLVLALAAGALIQLITTTNPISLIQAFNVDTLTAVVHSGPPGSYFGYSVAQHRDRGANWLLAGAPKAQTDQPKTKQSGAVYRCAPNAARACQQIQFDPNGSSSISLRDQLAQTDDKSHQFFGASLASAIDNGSIVACAPRYVYYSTSLKRRDPVGSCWVSRGSFSGFLEYSPCRLNEQWGHHHLGSCQAGFSSAITKDGGKIFMGAPGAHVWQGQVFAHNLRSDLTNSTSWENPHSEDDSYLGYSLATGRFSALSSSAAAPANELDLAIGIPRGNDLAGKVMLVDRELRTLRNISGEQLGAYFGYSLATIDANGDGLDDLAIGAPLHYNETHKDQHYDRGRVYIVQQSSRHEFTVVQRLDGQRSRARFGTALANCGDLNRDGFQDLAVGAPYDGPDNHGAVYIFMGGRRSHSNGAPFADEPDQVIYAEQVRAEGPYLRSFGFALSGGLDQDGNQYPDLLVGDYEADRIVLLKARPVVNVTFSIQFQPEHFNLDDKSCLLPNTDQSVPCITVQYCTKYSGLNIDQRLGFQYNIKLDTENKGGQPRMFFLHSDTPQKSEERNSSQLVKDVLQCKSFKAYLGKQIRDKLTPLRVDIDYSLSGDKDQPGSLDYSPRLRPVLAKPAGDNRATSKAALIQRNCGSDNVCVPDLKLLLRPNMDRYTIGSQEKLIMDVTVRNNGEDAYESMFYLTMPMSVRFNIVNASQGQHVNCDPPKPEMTGTNVVACDLGNPLQRNEQVKFQVITEPRSEQFTSRDLTFKAQVNSSNPELDNRHREDNEVIIGVSVHVETNLVISGHSQPPTVEHNITYHKQQLQQQQQSPSSLLNIKAPLANHQTSEASVGPEVLHIYQLHNRGRSTINDIAVTILWPSKSSSGDHLLYLVEEPITLNKVKCKPSREGVVNPLNLRSTSKPKVISSIVTNTNQQPINNQSYVLNSRLFKRQATRSSQQETSQELPEPLAQTTTYVDDSILQQYLTMCGPSNQCARFDCHVSDLATNDIATIKIRSRLFEETVNKLMLQEFVISSRLVAQIKSLPYNVSTTDMLPFVHKVETLVHTTGMSFQDLLPWWLVILAILLGIGLFILLACFLKYLGFFARKRPPKGAEREPLTPTMWNDYQYSPGDTAL